MPDAFASSRSRPLASRISFSLDMRPSAIINKSLVLDLCRQVSQPTRGRFCGFSFCFELSDGAFHSSNPYWFLMLLFSNPYPLPLDPPREGEI